jgi:hypothetical protein
LRLAVCWSAKYQCKAYDVVVIIGLGLL